MSYAPATLKAAREYLLAKLDVHPGEKRWADLDPDEVGIVAGGTGDSYHRGDDTLGSDRRYSVGESSRDRNGLSNAASALDIGEFDVTIGGRRLTLRRFNAWLVAECKAGAPDTRDIRSVIYTLDGQAVKRWDRLGIRSSGDNSHLWHTHISYFRDSESRDKTALFRRYVEGDDDMSWEQKIPAQKWARDAGLYATAGYDDGADVTGEWHQANTNGNVRKIVLRQVPEILAGQAAILAAVNGESADEIQARVRAELERAAEIERTERQAENAAVIQALRDEVPALAESLAGLTGEEIGAALGEWLAARLGQPAA